MRALLALATAIMITAAGCGESVPCVGKVVEKYVGHQDGVVINTGQSGVGIPVGGGDVFYLVIERSDASSCSREVSKKRWLSTRVGSEVT